LITEQGGVKKIVTFTNESITQILVFCVSSIEMNRKFSMEWMGLVIGVVYWFLVRNLSPFTILATFYSIYMGWVWGLIPTVSNTEALSWRHVFPPLVLVVLLMVSANSGVGANAEWVSLTAMALLHLRAGVLSATRLGMKALLFSVLQAMGFALPMFYLFHKNLNAYSIPQFVFIGLMILMGVLSIGILLNLKRKMNAKGSDQSGSNRSDSRVLS